MSSINLRSASASSIVLPSTSQEDDKEDESPNKTTEWEREEETKPPLSVKFSGSTKRSHSSVNKKLGVSNSFSNSSKKRPKINNLVKRHQTFSYLQNVRPTVRQRKRINRKGLNPSNACRRSSLPYLSPPNGPSFFVIPRPPSTSRIHSGFQTPIGEYNNMNNSRPRSRTLSQASMIMTQADYENMKMIKKMRNSSKWKNRVTSCTGLFREKDIPQPHIKICRSGSNALTHKPKKTLVQRTLSATGSFLFGGRNIESVKELEPAEQSPFLEGDENMTQNLKNDNNCRFKKFRNNTFSQWEVKFFVEVRKRKKKENTTVFSSY